MESIFKQLGIRNQLSLKSICTGKSTHGKHRPRPFPQARKYRAFEIRLAYEQPAEILGSVKFRAAQRTDPSGIASGNQYFAAWQECHGLAGCHIVCDQEFPKTLYRNATRVGVQL